MTLIPKLSVIIPVYNAASSLGQLYESLQEALRTVGRYELIFVDDGSQDASLECLHRIARQDPAVTVAVLGRNVGQQEATLHGLSLASGRYCATMDDDGQHPPALLPAMLDLLQEESLDIVYAVPEGKREGCIRTLGSIMRDRMFSALFPYCGNTRVSSYRVMARTLVQRVLAQRGRFNYFSAMVFQEPTLAATVPYPFLLCHTSRTRYRLSTLFSLYWKIFLYYGPFAAKRTTRQESFAEMETH